MSIKFPSPGRAAEAVEHLYDADEKIATGLKSRIAQDVSVVEQFQRSRAFHCAAASHAVEAALVVGSESSRAFRDVEDDAFGCPQQLIAQVCCAAHML